MNRFRAPLLFFAIWFGVLPVQAAGYVDEIAALYWEGRPIEAFAIARENLEAGEGDPRFDLYLGLVAVDAGYLSFGVPALERYLLVRPGDAQARFALARTLYTLGQYARAQREFETLEQASDAPEIVAAIKPYLETLAKDAGPDAAGYETALHMRRAGHDSRVAADPLLFPSVTERLPAAVPYPIALGSSSTALREAPGGFGASAVAPEASAAGGSMEIRAFSLGDDTDRYRLEMRRERGPAASEPDHELVAFGTSWQRSIGDGASLTGFAHYARLDFPASDQTGAEQGAVGLGLSQAFEGRWRPELYGALYVGAERSVPQDVEQPIDPARDLYGLRLGAQMSLAPALSVDLTGQVQRREYQEAAVEAHPRRDDYLNLELGATWGFEANWSLRASLGYSENDSNVEVQEQYERAKAGLSIQYRY